MLARVQPPAPAPAPGPASAGTMEEAKKKGGRGEVDFSAPFRSVKEAVDRFGGSSAPSRPPQRTSVLLSAQDVELMKLVEQTVKLEMDLFLKERETLNVLQELERTKKLADSLKLRLQSEASQVSEDPARCSGTVTVSPFRKTPDKCLNYFGNHTDTVLGDQNLDQKPTPSLILMELKQAKLYLNKSTTRHAGNHSAVALLKSAIENEKLLLKETRERLNSKIVQASSLEQEISLTLKQMELMKHTKTSGYESPSRTLSHVKKLKSETEEFKRVAEAAKEEISKLSLDIQHTKSSIKTAEVRFAVAKKVEAAARSAEAAALSKIKPPTEGRERDDAVQNTSKVAISVEEYATLTKRVREGDEILRAKVEAVMADLEDAQRSKLELLEKVEEAHAYFKTGRKALNEALKKEEDANRGKVAAEEALRKWRYQHDRTRRRSYLTNTKFKNASTANQRRAWILDVNGLSMVAAGPSGRTDGPTLSIGQILNRKLVGNEEFESRELQIVNDKPKVSLRQMLSRKDDFLSPVMMGDGGSPKQFPAKRKKLTVLLLSLFLAKQRKRQWRSSANCRGNNI